jgi:hypothetical protein
MAIDSGEPDMRKTAANLFSACSKTTGSPEVAVQQRPKHQVLKPDDRSCSGLKADETGKPKATDHGLDRI